MLEALAGARHDGDVGKAVQDLLAHENAALNKVADRLESGREEELLEIRNRAERDLEQGRLIPLAEVVKKLNLE